MSMNLKDHFERCYLKSLNEYRFFYDDVYEYGHAETARHIFYFIPGLNGAPGQIRFALPGFHRVLQNDFYIRCLYLSEFSARIPVWEKYTPANLESRRATIREDLANLTTQYGRIYVVASSTGFYDFAAAVRECSDQIRKSVTLLWVAAAPDHVEPTRWETLFYPLNGIERDGYRWTALPNHNVLSFFNPETRTTFRWQSECGSQVLYKHNLESRFRAHWISWAYFSRDCTNSVLRHCTDCVSEPLDIEAYVLAAKGDGYWQGKSPDGMKRVIGKYLSNTQYLWRRASHLWVSIPQNTSELLELAMRGGSPK